MSPNQITAKKPLRILCAEDNTMIGELLIKYLSAAGHAAEHVADGFEAWEKISAGLGCFDVLITDHQMPGLNGLELVELLRQANYRGRIVVHSGAVGAEETASYRALGVDAIVAKAASTAELLSAVEAFAAA